MEDHSADSKKRTITDDLDQDLKSHINISSFLKKNADAFISSDIGELITEKLKKANITKTLLARQSGMSEVYLYQILSGRRTPSRDKMICLCIGLGLDLESTQDLLKKAGFATLYSRVRREAIIIYAIEEHWDIHKLNDALFDIEEETMF